MMVGNGYNKYPDPGKSKIHNKSTKSWNAVQLVHNKSTTNPQQIHNISNKWSLTFNVATLPSEMFVHKYVQSWVKRNPMQDLAIQNSC